ncbi:Protein SprT [Saliniradius amylolyticus]|uniref:Protein SprT n=1 Tax=Saliniradius amylolyticus TaxID=2183582 RepID=A0A2S2E3E5_9ALTE|nr:SprT family zinc-dependent metalloprotease [Saliniradius amylolyticus]AWL11527.1 Protein SprT [Saliniradius amylolyticus]
MLHTQQLHQRVEHCYCLAEQKLGRSFPRPKVSLKQRGKAAGSARLQTNELRFNPVLLAENPQAFFDEVIPHEICHLLTWQLYGRVRPHGKEWRGLMGSVFGLTGKASHQMDVSSVRGKTFAYSCDCGPVELTIRRHNKIQRGQARYYCKKCACALTPAH